MNRRITKAMASDAALKMQEAVYGPQLEAVNKEKDFVGTQIISKYIPSPVIACIKEYQSFFEVYRVVGVFYWRSSNWRSEYIYVKLPYNVPKGAKYIEISESDYKDLLEFVKVINKLKDEKMEFGERIISALISLKYENKVKEHLPEALEYIEFPVVKALPEPIYNDIRNILKNAKNNAKK